MKRIKQQFMEEYFCDPVPDYDDYITGKCGGQLAEEHEFISISQLKEEFKEFEFKNNINKSLVATKSFALQYEERLPFINAWRNRIGVSIANEDMIDIDTMDINPLTHDDSKIGLWVIHDKYIEHRLALMKGYELEYEDKMHEQWDKAWGVTPTCEFSGDVLRYRVKARVDTSWIIDGGYCKYDSKVFQIKVRGNDVSIPELQRYGYTKEIFTELYQEWKPEQDELCWFWNDNSYPALGEFSFKTGGYCNANFENIRPYFGEKFWENSYDNPDSKWRLPTIDELISAYSEMDKESLDEFNRYCYWSSTINAHHDKIAWVLHFEDGYTNPYWMDATNHVIYVRDTCDGLEWGEVNKKVATWDEALKYAKSINQMESKS